MNLMQNSAVSTSFCVNQDMQILPDVLNILKHDFHLKFNKDLHLFTIRHYNQEAIDYLKQGRKVLLEQITRNTFQMVVRADD